MDRTSVARRIQLGAVRILQTKIAEASDGIMAKLQYSNSDDHSECPGWLHDPPVARVIRRGRARDRLR